MNLRKLRARWRERAARRRVEAVVENLIANKGQRAVRQHYVPLAYLERFTEDGRTIWVFDKHEQRSFKANKADIAQEKGFYDLQFDVSTDAGAAKFNQAQLAEAAFAQLDGDYAQVLHQLNAVSPGANFPDELRVSVIFFLCLQKLRTREARDDAIAEFTAVHTELAKAQYGEEFPELLSGELRVSTSPDYYSLVHLSRIFDPDLWKAMGAALDSFFCFLLDFGDSRTAYTSDHPVAFVVHGIRTPLEGAGMASVGSEILLPISPSRVLVLQEPTFHKGGSKVHLQCITGATEHLELCNRLQVANAYRWIFCAQDAFEPVRALFVKNPRLAEKRGARIHVSSGDTESSY